MLNPLIVLLYNLVLPLESEPIIPRYGPVVETIVEAVIQETLNAIRPALGTNEVADGFELFPEPVLNVNDDVAESAQVDIEDEPYLFSLGLLDLSGRFGPRSELFSRALNLNFDRDADDDDAYQLLKEIIDGDGGAVVDLEREPGIEGVQLVSLTPDAYTLTFDNDVVVDVLTLVGPGIVGVLEDLDAPANVADAVNHLSLVDIASETVTAGPNGQNPIADLLEADEVVNTQAELEAILAAALDQQDTRVQLLGLEPDNFAVRINNAATGAFDLIIFFGDSTESAIDAVLSDTIVPSNRTSELVVADLAGTADVASGKRVERFFRGRGVPSVGETVTEDELFGITQTADRRSRVIAIDQGGTVRLEIDGPGGTFDIIVFETMTNAPSSF